MKTFLHYWLINDENPKRYLVDLFITFLICISILSVCLESILGTLPHMMQLIDEVTLFLFIVEYCARFYICSNFRVDYKERGILHACKQKLSWMLQWSSIFDFLAIIPALNYFKTFRMLRYLRLIRLIRLIKAFKIIRDMHKLIIILKGMKEENRVFYIFFSITMLLIFITAFGLYLVENTASNDFSSYSDSLLYALKTIELLDDTPATFIGKILSSFLLLSNIAIFGFFISIISNKIQLLMDTITSGKIQRLNLTNHTIICGYTKSARTVINELLADKKNHNQIVLLTTQAVEDIAGLIYVNADYTEYKSLEKVNISKAKNAIVFAETKATDTLRDVDLRTVMTVFHIEKTAPHVHTIAEINDSQNAEIIQDKINGDEIIYKELIDAKIIHTCIKNPNISNLFYELFGTTHPRIQTTSLTEIAIDNPCTIKQIKQRFIELDKTFLGFIDAYNKPHLSPNNATAVSSDCQLVYI